MDLGPVPRDIGKERAQHGGRRYSGVSAGCENSDALTSALCTIFNFIESDCLGDRGRFLASAPNEVRGALVRSRNCACDCRDVVQSSLFARLFGSPDVGFEHHPWPRRLPLTVRTLFHPVRACAFVWTRISRATANISRHVPPRARDAA